MEKTITKFENLHQVLKFIKKLDENLADSNIIVNLAYIENELDYLTDLMGNDFPEDVKFFPDDYYFVLNYAENEQYREQVHQYINIDAWRNVWNDSVNYIINFEYVLTFKELETGKHYDFTINKIVISGKIDVIYDYEKSYKDENDTDGFTLQFETNDETSKATAAIYRIITDAIEQVKEGF